MKTWKVLAINPDGSKTDLGLYEGEYPEEGMSLARKLWNDTRILEAKEVKCATSTAVIRKDER